MRHYERSKRALYWTAVSLIVCEGLPLEQAARRMGIDHDQLKDILYRRRTVHLDQLDFDRQEDATAGVLLSEHVH